MPAARHIDLLEKGRRRRQASIEIAFADGVPVIAIEHDPEPGMAEVLAERHHLRAGFRPVGEMRIERDIDPAPLGDGDQAVQHSQHAITSVYGRLDGEFDDRGRLDGLDDASNDGVVAAFMEHEVDGSDINAIARLDDRQRGKIGQRRPAPG
ncbi:hypothetical protein D9M73_105080 [compost metagenome]